MTIDELPSDAPPPVPTHPKSIAGHVTTRLPTPFSLPTSSLSNNPFPKQFTTYPAEWLAHYRAFVRANASQVSSIESALRSVTYILPGRFNESPLTSEAVYTSLTLLSAFHTNLLSPDSNSTSTSRLSPQARYERWCRATGGAIYARASALLRTVQYIQLLCEMIAKRSGEKLRWRVVVLLEIIKAVCRMLMSRVTGWRPVVASSIGAESQDRISGDTPRPENGDIIPSSQEGSGEEDKVNTSNNPPSAAATIPTDSGYASDATEYKMPRTGLILPTQLPSTTSSSSSPSSSLTNYLTSLALTPDEVKPPPRLVHPLRTPKAHLAELLHILRPVIYALALQRAATATADFTSAHSSGSRNASSVNRTWKHAWTPWLLGLALELLSRQLAKQDVRETRVGGLKGLSVVERDERARRGWRMGWWAVRGAFYENVVRVGLVDGVAGRLKGKFVLDMLAVVVEDYAWLWDEFYFSSASV